MDTGQTPLEIVHLKVVVSCKVRPVTPEVSEDAVVAVPVPNIVDHAPVPMAATFPAKVAVVMLHRSWSVPAIATVGNWSMVIVTSSAASEQAPSDTVHLKVADAPMTNPVTPEVAKEGVVIVAVPEVIVHTPVPTAGTLPARVAVVTLHNV